MKKFLGFKIKETKPLPKTGGGLTLAKLKRAKEILDAHNKKQGDNWHMCVLSNPAQYKFVTGKNPPKGTKFPIVITQ